jgi:signal transduction histidine kinase
VRRRVNREVSWIPFLAEKGLKFPPSSLTTSKLKRASNCQLEKCAALDQSKFPVHFGDVVDSQYRSVENEKDRYDAPKSAVAEFPTSHTVHFYEHQSGLLDNLCDFAGKALHAGHALVVVLTEEHRQGLVDRLERTGLDIQLFANEDRFITLNAEETLAQFMVEGWPDKSLLCEVSEPVLQRAKAAAERNSGTVAVFGEMVALLSEQGKHEAAIYLEKLWDALRRQRSLILRCAYPLACFAAESDHDIFHRICAVHDHVIPSESYTSLDNEDDRLRMISLLQQRASLMEALVEGREREIAQRKQAELKLRQAEQLAEQVLESSLDCMKLLDLEGHLEYMSPIGQKVLEIDDVGQILGKRWMDFWKEEDQPRVKAALVAARSGQVGCFQGILPTKGGPTSWDVRVSPVVGDDGKVKRLIAVSRDITQLERSQQVAVQAEKLAAAGRLAATIAHEINNPLEAVTNLIYLAKSWEGVPIEVCKQLEIADRELARVAQLAQQTLGFYRDNTSSKWVPVAELVDDVLLIYERKLKYKYLEAVISLDPDLKIFGKQGELKQALSNLMANAIEASKISGKIWLSARTTKNWTNEMEPGVRITVADNGSGMGPEVRRQIFVPFFTTKPGIGTGIGLWVTKSLIEQQGGFMRFRSKQGQNAGTVMSFFVPDERKSTADGAL